MNKSKHYLYGTYRNMKSRCYNANNPVYRHYGARGISVCDRWLGKSGFDNFLEDMGQRPQGMSLDRIDNDLGYRPENCRWADKVTQSNNTRWIQRGRGTIADGNGFCARITIKNKTVYLGFYKTESAAHEAYLTARTQKLKALGL